MKRLGRLLTKLAKSMTSMHRLEDGTIIITGWDGSAYVVPAEEKDQ